jgi:Family of unknown function (DUF5684)
MNAYRIPVIALCFWMALQGVCFAKSVYLSDGGRVDCESFWRKGDLVFVKVNRDVVVEFSRDEVDFNKTFRSAASRKRHTSTHKREVAKSGTSPSVTLESPAVVSAKPAPKPLIASPELKTQNAGIQEKKGGASTTAAIPLAATQAKPETGVNPVPAPKRVLRQRTPESDPQVLAPSPGIPMLPLLAALALLLLMVVANWKIFEKAGEAGWKSLIPIYNLYVLIKIAGKPGWWLLLTLIPLVNIAIFLMTMLALAERFGKGALFGVGLFLLGFIFFPLLAFDGSEYYPA